MHLLRTNVTYVVVVALHEMEYVPCHQIHVPMTQRSSQHMSLRPSAHGTHLSRSGSV